MGGWEGIKEQPFVISQRLWLSQSHQERGNSSKAREWEMVAQKRVIERRRERVKEEGSIPVAAASLLCKARGTIF